MIPLVHQLEEEDFERLYPCIAWHTPLRVDVDGKIGLVCRFCLARYGVKGAELDQWPNDPAGFQMHMANLHNRTWIILARS